ncbi:hypothetical protein PSTG_16819 [Puccinia striiformis f. sp. tritici PST-78]|uniref:hAT-like transposase RNase-H fold domain-containing protein n=1 Tax=Puccinia striiformis f. sp. tritici PST-78 TaxID=1165861 RepID=A0A0L0URL2_9BASI|nr:hypothetical protein PSTG_16819 [Puccinia striiformis f. sp. tritici PST-78]
MAEASQICLTTDMWTAIDLTGYMVVTAHYILNEWELVKRIIGFKPLPPPHNGPAIAERLGHTLHEWKAISKVGFITLDNASANNSAVSRLQQFVNDRCRTAGSVEPTSAYFHVRCLAHVINLVVKDGLKHVGSAVTHLQDSVLYIHGSLARLDSFEDALEQSHLRRSMKHPTKDMPTRWNATYLMIKSVLPCKLAFQHLEMTDTKFEDCPTEAEWDHLVAMKAFLEPFFTATNDLSGTQYPTLNLAYRAMRQIEKAINDYKKTHYINDPLSLSIEPMKAKFNKYWEPIKVFLAIGLVLDPRFKMQYFRFTLEESCTVSTDIQTFLGQVRAGILDLWALYVPTSPTAQPSSDPKADKPLDEETARFYRYMNVNGSNGASQSNAPEAELDLYLEKPNLLVPLPKNLTSSLELPPVPKECWDTYSGAPNSHSGDPNPIHKVKRRRGSKPAAERDTTTAIIKPRQSSPKSLLKRITKNTIDSSPGEDPDLNEQNQPKGDIDQVFNVEKPSRLK